MANKTGGNMPTPKREERERQILEALQARKEWLSRAGIAKALGRERLNGTDMEALASLEARGLIEVENRPDARPAGFVAFYRIK